jgi:hypothetical protein
MRRESTTAMLDDVMRGGMLTKFKGKEVKAKLPAEKCTRERTKIPF